MNDAVEIIETRTLAKAWGTLTSVRLRLKRRDGAWSEQTREVYDHGDAAAVLLCDVGRGEVVLVRQFRFPLHGKETSPYLLEVCAGLLEGKTAESTAHAEAEEETGYLVSGLTEVCTCYASPGSLSEKITLFVGYCDAGAPASEGGGVADEGEDIEIVRMAFPDALAMIAKGEILDAKTIILLQWAALKGVFDPNAR